MHPKCYLNNIQLKKQTYITFTLKIILTCSLLVTYLHLRNEVILLEMILYGKRKVKKLIHEKPPFVSSEKKPFQEGRWFLGQMKSCNKIW